MDLGLTGRGLFVVRPAVAYDPKPTTGRSYELEMPEELEPFATDRLITDVVGKIKEGKEAEVYLCAAHPSTGERLFAAKVHRAFEHRRFRNDAIYREGRAIGSRTVAKAMEQRSRFGQEMLGATWLDSEHRTLRDMEGAGVRVPRVWGRADHALLLEFIGSDDGEAAPPLRALDVSPRAARALWHDLKRSIVRALAANTVHGDLSPYNVLVKGTDAYIIDWPQAVDPRKNPNARWLFERDICNILTYFARHGIREDGDMLAGVLWDRWTNNRL